MGQKIPGQPVFRGRRREPAPADVEYEVDAVLAHRRLRKRVYFLVLWKDYPREASTWEPDENLQNATRAVEDFWSRQGDEEGPLQMLQWGRGQGKGNSRRAQKRIWRAEVKKNGSGMRVVVEPWKLKNGKVADSSLADREKTQSYPIPRNLPSKARLQTSRLPPVLYRAFHSSSQGQNPQLPYQHPFVSSAFLAPKDNIQFQPGDMKTLPKILAAPHPPRSQILHLASAQESLLRWHTAVKAHLNISRIPSPYISFASSPLRAFHRAWKFCVEGKKDVFVAAISTSSLQQRSRRRRRRTPDIERPSHHPSRIHPPSRTGGIVQQTSDLIRYLGIRAALSGFGEFLIWGGVEGRDVVAVKPFQELWYAGTDLWAEAGMFSPSWRQQHHLSTPATTPVSLQTSAERAVLKMPGARLRLKKFARAARRAGVNGQIRVEAIGELTRTLLHGQVDVYGLDVAEGIMRDWCVSADDGRISSRTTAAGPWFERFKFVDGVLVVARVEI
ncbi:MAG: hypothetical protein M1817_004925 [Caeruleum heppii]|nr:MAG: hypothetical protein M1817_004925 [Caeruleum heppii]